MPEQEYMLRIRVMDYDSAMDSSYWVVMDSLIVTASEAIEKIVRAINWYSSQGNFIVCWDMTPDFDYANGVCNCPVCLSIRGGK